MSGDVRSATDGIKDTIALAQAQERLRQESETFDQKARQDAHWFRLRLAMGWVAVILLPAIMITSTAILVNPSGFTEATVTLAASTLFVDAAGLIFAVWRIVLGARSPDALGPVTAAPRVGGSPRVSASTSSRSGTAAEKEERRD